MGSVWLIWLDFDLKVDSNTGGEEEEEWGVVRAENFGFCGQIRAVQSPGNPDTAGELGKLITLRERADKKSKATFFSFFLMS